MATNTDASKKGKKRAARCQLDPSLVLENSKPEQTGQVFNIWYSKWTGGENNGRTSMVHAKHKCDVDKDSGYTKADRYATEGEINRSSFICLYFARGYCCNGKNCSYLHRIPSELDIFSPTVDCFGREKFMDYRDDMSGIGSFGKVNKTLYVGRISDCSGNIELKLSQVFGKFGDVASVRVLAAKNCAFVSYKLESQAQFAKEAMQCQSLRPGDASETLNIRWADDDPKYSSRKRAQREQDEMSMEAARKMLAVLKESNARKQQKTAPNEEHAEHSDHAEDDASVNGDSPTAAESDDPVFKAKLNLDSLDKIRQLRSHKEATRVTGLINGYSSSEDEDD